ncbi:MAG: hypothetical protein K2X53_06270 [Alphaproteobacteria bacterium]|nr:hypothetical protein [Alphaproteobacteria bacterium]
MKRKDKNDPSFAFWLILVGGFFCLLIPLLTPFFPIHYLSAYSNVGEVIGGMSSPFTQILGSTLIFLALKAQISANKILQQQIDKENKKDALRHELLFSIFPYQELDKNAHLKNIPCADCGKYHANYPPLIYDKLQHIKEYFL